MIRYRSVTLLDNLADIGGPDLAASSHIWHQSATTSLFHICFLSFGNGEPTSVTNTSKTRMHFVCGGHTIRKTILRIATEVYNRQS